MEKEYEKGGDPNERSASGRCNSVRRVSSESLNSIDFRNL